MEDLVLHSRRRNQRGDALWLVLNGAIEGSTGVWQRVPFVERDVRAAWGWLSLKERARIESADADMMKAA